MAVPHFESRPPGNTPGTLVFQPHRAVIGIRAEHIEGRFRRVTVHQLTMAWWLHIEGHITRRQLRVYFAAHEMSERREYMPEPTARSGQDRARKPRYRLGELQGLVGGRGSASAAAELQADIRGLAKLGLVRMTASAITFAQSIEQIKLEDVSGFWTMFRRMPNGRRAVPVPRRTLRALAAGFGRAETGVILALLIRSVFWHRESSGGVGRFRVDGRTKGSWIAEVFRISRRGVTNARSHLIEIGWLQPLDTPQWQLNRWGAHDRVNTDWSPRLERPDKPAAVGGEGEGPLGESASPQPVFSADNAMPCLNSSSSLKEENTNTRKPGHGAPDRSGVSARTGLGSRKKERGGRGDREPPAPTIRDIQAADLGDTDRLIELHRQASEIGLARPSEAGRLAFMALAERARTRGKKPGALFAWLLREKKYAFITQADEDEAARRIRELYNGRRGQREEWGGWDADEERADSPQAASEPDPLTADDRFVLACIRVAKQHRIDEPFRVARMKDWSRAQWDAALSAYTVKMADQARTSAVVDFESEG